MNKEPMNWLGGKFHFDFQTRKSRIEPMEDALSSYAGVDGLQILEIGSCEGQSTLWFIKTLLTGKDCNITCIDPHTPNRWYDSTTNPIKAPTDKTTYDMFQENILDKYSHLVEYHRDESDNILSTLKKQFDIIYVDGRHSIEYVYRDILGSWPLLKNGGIIMLDDFNEHSPVCEGAKRAFTEIGVMAPREKCNQYDYAPGIDVLWNMSVFIGKKQL